MEGLAQWNAFCAQPQTILTNIQPKQDIFRYLLDSFNLTDNRQAPTFRALNDMATILHQHVRAMLKRFSILISKCIFKCDNFFNSILS